MAKKKKSKPNQQVIAGTGRGRDITRGLMTGLIPPQDEILLLKGGGEYQLYERILSDAQVFSCLQNRFASVVGCERDVLPGGDGVLDREAAIHLKGQLDTWWDTAANKHLYGVFYGYSFAELLYGVGEDLRYRVEEIRVRNRRRFKFFDDLTPRLVTYDSPIHGEELPPQKFWYFSAGADNHDDPYGRGLAHYLYWPVWLKRNGLRFWSIFLEKFGQPTPLGRYEAGATESEQSKLLEALDAIRTETGVVLPHGMGIEYLEASRSGTADYSAFTRQMDGYISKLILGHSAAADATPGRLGGETGAVEVANHLLKADADLLCESFNRGPALWLTNWNFPGAKPPQLWLATEPPDDVSAQAEVHKKLFEQGYRLRPDAVIQLYGDYFDQVEPPAEPAQAAEPLAFAAGQPRQPSDDPEAIAAVLAKRGNPIIETWLQVVKIRLEEGGDLAEFAAALDTLAPELDLAAMSGLMAEAMALAHLVGRDNA